MAGGSSSKGSSSSSSKGGISIPVLNIGPTGATVTTQHSTGQTTVPVTYGTPNQVAPPVTNKGTTTGSSTFKYSGGGGGGGGSSGGGGGGRAPSPAPTTTTTGGVSITPAPAPVVIPQPTAQQKLDVVKDTYTKNVVGLPKDNFNPLFKEGSKTLSLAEQQTYARQTGMAGVSVVGLSSGQYSTTATGRGTIIRGPDISGKTKFDLANLITNQATEKITNEQNKIIDTTKTTYVNKLDNYKNTLQTYVNEGKMSVEDANKDLNKYATEVNNQYIKDVNKKVQDSPIIKSISNSATNQLIRTGLTDTQLNAKISKFEQVTGIPPSIARQGLEIGATIVAPEIALPVIAGVYTVEAAKELAKAPEIIQAKYDAQGNIISFTKVDKQLTPKFYEKAIGAAAFGIPAGYGAIKNVAAEITTEQAIRQAGSKTITMAELQSGKIMTKVPNYLTGKIETIPVKITNAQKVIAYKDLLRVSEGKTAKVLKFESVVDINEANKIKGILTKDSLTINKNTIMEDMLSKESKLTRVLIETPTGKIKEVYITSKAATINGKGAQLDLILGRKPLIRIVNLNEKDLANKYQLLKFSTPKQFKKTFIPLKDSNYPLLVESENLQRLSIGDIAQKQKSVTYEFINGQLRVTNKLAVGRQTGKAIGEKGSSIYDVLTNKPAVFKQVKTKPQVLTSKQIDVFLNENKGKVININTKTGAIELTSTRSGKGIEFGKELSLPPKPPIRYEKIPSMPYESPAPPFKPPTSPKQPKIIIKKSTKEVGNVLANEIDNLPKMVGGTGLKMETISKNNMMMVNRKELIDAEQALYNPLVGINLKDLGINSQLRLVTPKLTATTNYQRVYSGYINFQPQVKNGYLQPALKMNTLTYDNLFKSPTKTYIQPIQKLGYGNVPVQKIGVITEELLTTKFKTPTITIPQNEIPRMPKTNIPIKPIDFNPFPPTGRNSLSLGESTRINPNRIYRQPKAQYTASLGSAIFGIAKKVKYKDLQKTLAKLSSRAYLGIEQRPTIEVIPNKPIKKVNYKKLYKSLSI